MTYDPKDYELNFTRLRLSFDCVECGRILEADTPVTRFGKGRGICLDCYETMCEKDPSLPPIGTRWACHHCGRPATMFSGSAFLGEIHPESDNPEVFWCEECAFEDWANI